MVDVAIVGGGPAGLAVAIEAAGKGLSTLVLERRSGPPDKACGEGLMPAGVRALEALGAAVLVPPDGCAPFVGIRYLQEDGTGAAARFPRGWGLGVRRLALAQALTLRARAAGASLQHGNGVHGVHLGPDGVMLDTDGGPVHARFLVAADGLTSPIRRAAGLEGAPVRRRRFGVRRHYVVQPWSDHVEVHWADGVEAYVTPAGPRRVGIAFLWDEGRIGPQRFDRLLERFPALRAALAGAVQESEDRGAGPLHRRVLGRVAGRVALVGDAAGYVDALSGEGLTLAFGQAAGLGAVLPAAVVHGGAALTGWEAESAAAFRRYAWITGALLQLSRHPALRRRVIRQLARHPRIFARLLAAVVEGPGSELRAGPAPALLRG
ncbi:NAD(P)/FAD-dependent oxidoreductase [Vulgatibacter sp.]|uniref:NAD(P)/FAD-dependent oxidoreductase n=1 Tax=Vulgatibacter sp. TaxID=1971226 RepID=UPI003568BCF8